MFVKIRIPKTREGTVSGYFDNKQDAAEAIDLYDGREDVKAIYVSLNPSCKDANNILESFVRTATSRDDIVRREWMLIDCDPCRQSGKSSDSSTDAELAAALAKTRQIETFLVGELGFPEPVVGCSGNGGHLLISIDLANNDESSRLIQSCLDALDLIFSDSQVKVDTGVADASRICKAYGTVTRKGDNTTERPHRRSYLISRLADNSAITKREQLSHLGNLAPAEEKEEPRSSSGVARADFDVPGALAKWGLEVKFDAPLKGKEGDWKWVLETCPFDPSHTDGCALVIQFKSGATCFRCLHNSCRRYKWKDLRERFEPGCSDRLNGGASLSNGKKSEHGEQTEAIEWEDAQPWPTLDPTALYGLAGDFVRTVSPHSEANGSALLAQFLCEFGCAVGPSAHVMVEATRHPGRIFTLIIGATAGGRKGTARDQVSRVFRVADLEWHEGAQISGLASGEGLIERLKDRADNNVEKRVLVSESEFVRLLTAASRDGSTLGAVIRDAWESERLQHLTRQNPLIATNCHIAIIGHITPDELRAKLSSTDIASGFFNRFIPFCVKRSKRLPQGGSLPKAEIERLGKRVSDALRFGRHVNEVKRTPAGNEAWERFYYSVPEPQGLLGAVTARAEPQVLRMSLLLALLDSKSMIDACHVKAAEAVWAYAHASAEHIFGSKLGDNVADRVLDELRATFPNGCDREHLYRLFSGHINATRLKAATEYLCRRGLASTETVRTDRRSREIAYAVRRELSDSSEKIPADQNLPSPKSLESHVLSGDERAQNGEVTAMDLLTEPTEYQPTARSLSRTNDKPKPPTSVPMVPMVPDDSRADVDTWWDVRESVFDLLTSLVDLGFSFEIRDDVLKVNPAPDASISAELQMRMDDVMRFIAEVGDGKWPLPPGTPIEAKPFDPAQELCEFVSFANDRGVSMCRDDKVIQLCGPLEDVHDISNCISEVPIPGLALLDCCQRSRGEKEEADCCNVCGVSWDKHVMTWHAVVMK